MTFNIKTSACVILLFSSLIIQETPAHAQTNKYHRSSLYSILIRHPEKEFGNDIDTVFREMPIPEKFDDSSLKVRAINESAHASNKASEEENIVNYTIKPFIEKNQIAKRLVAKWFNRKSGRNSDGTFDMELIKSRGLYDADWFDHQVANESIRGKALLADAGEELIGQTYVLFNDIQYLDKEEIAGVASGVMSVASAIVSNIPGGGLVGTAISTGMDASRLITSKIQGFRVSITSYLYRLEWNDEIASTFYSSYYIDKPDSDKKNAFDQDKTLFRLEFIGMNTVKSANTTLRGVQSKNDMIRKVCERALDKNIAELQHKYEIFRVKTPVYSVEPLTAKIGIKEDIDKDSRFEVLEMVEDENGTVSYRKVGEVMPVEGRIWDNRYMAEFEDDIVDKSLTATEFRIVSGNGFQPGMLIREIN